MSISAIYSTQHSREQYTQYLQDQLQKMSSFMLYQKKENQKYNQLTQLIEDQNDKIKFLNDKVMLLELYQNQNIKNQQKLFSSFQKANSFEKRLTHLQQTTFTHSGHQLFNQKNTHFNQNNDLVSQVEERIDSFRQEIHQEIIRIENNLTRKLNLISNYQESSQGTYSMKLKKNKHENSNNMSPMETNYSQNDKSRLNEFDRNIPMTQREHKQNNRKISAFSNQRKPSQLQQQSTEKHQKVPSIHTEFKDISKFVQQQQRSPISQYLKKENQYNSSHEHTNPKDKSIKTKQFNSAFEIKDTHKQKTKSKRTRSKSKSRSKSNRSLSKKPQISKTIKTEKAHSKKIKVSKQKKTSNNTSRISQTSLSRVSNKSRSRSKSQQKMLKNQKKYLMFCKRIH